MQEQLFPIPQGKLISEKISKRPAVSMWARKRKGQPIVAENLTRNINGVEEKVAHNPTTELRNINLQENSMPAINKQFSQCGNGPPLPGQLFPFNSIFQPPLTVVPVVNFSRPVVNRVHKYGIVLLY